MVKVRNNDIVVALGNMEKIYYDRVKRKTFFQVMRDYGVPHESIVGLI